MRVLTRNVLEGKITSFLNGACKKGIYHNMQSTALTFFWREDSIVITSQPRLQTLTIIKGLVQYVNFVSTGH